MRKGRGRKGTAAKSARGARRKAVGDDGSDSGSGSGSEGAGAGGGQTSLVEAVARARDACRFRYLTAASVCVYGIPVYLGD